MSIDDLPPHTYIEPTDDQIRAVVIELVRDAPPETSAVWFVRSAISKLHAGRPDRYMAIVLEVLKAS